MLDRLGFPLAKELREPTFYLHELCESNLISQGAISDVAHEAALEAYGVSNFALYHPEVIQIVPRGSLQNRP